MIFPRNFFHVNPDFSVMKICLSKISGLFTSKTEGIQVWGELQAFGFYKFGIGAFDSGERNYMIYDECCLNSWRLWKENIISGKSHIFPMEVKENFFKKNFIVLKKFPGKFDGPQFLFDS